MSVKRIGVYFMLKKKPKVDDVKQRLADLVDMARKASRSKSRSAVDPRFARTVARAALIHIARLETKQQTVRETMGKLADTLEHAAYEITTVEEGLET